MNIVIAGIVSYNPTPDRLKANILSILPQVKKVVVVDNDSSNIESIQSVCNTSNVVLIRNGKNEGIARALNQIFEYAINTYGTGSYVLTLDQDSVVYPDIIETYRKYFNIDNIASLTSLRVDRNYPVIEKNGAKEYEFVNKCITSGNLVKTDVWKKIGGFDERLFIDMVDSEFCYRLLEKEFKILRVNKIELEHELGNAFRVNFLGRMRTVLNHSAFRRYYIFRNTILLLRKYKIAHEDYSYTGLIKSILSVIFFEDDKYNKIKRSIYGTIDGFRMKLDN